MKCSEEKFEAFIHLKDFLGGYAASQASLDTEVCEEMVAEFGMVKIKKAIAIWNDELRVGEARAIAAVRKYLKIDG